MPFHARIRQTQLDVRSLHQAHVFTKQQCKFLDHRSSSFLLQHCFALRLCCIYDSTMFSILQTGESRILQCKARHKHARIQRQRGRKRGVRTIVYASITCTSTRVTDLISSLSIENYNNYYNTRVVLIKTTCKGTHYYNFVPIFEYKNLTPPKAALHSATSPTMYHQRIWRRDLGFFFFTHNTLLNE